eukprot:TRINITY_DN1291_c0_g1_i1.p2 TRINITY_DN1291_c0_g1~~TRINITY_DN1291_c0_g1_i1.p2  ORF type:complete len:424 (-),score=38.79 TRINITY_DN1291_c0_g1_i1:94-1365(-)
MTNITNGYYSNNSQNSNKMEDIIVNDETISTILSRFPKPQWPRLIRALVLYGIETFKKNTSFPSMSLAEIEGIAAPSTRQDRSLQIFMKEIESIKNSLHKLDKKIETSITSKGLSISSNNTIQSIQQQRSIYPSWWGPPDSNRLATSTFSRTNEKASFEEMRKQESERYKHEMEVTAVAVENARNNALAAKRNPIKMVFEKQEFSGPQVHLRPNPVIIEKKREMRGTIREPPLVNDAIPELRQSQSQFYASRGKENDSFRGNSEDERMVDEGGIRKRAESMVKFADNCMASEIINHFSRDASESHPEGSQSQLVEESENSDNAEQSENLYPEQDRREYYIYRNAPIRQTVPRGEGRNVYDVANSRAYTYVNGSGEIYRREDDPYDASGRSPSSGYDESRREEEDRNKREFTLGDNCYVYDPTN